MSFLLKEVQITKGMSHVFFFWRLTQVQFLPGISSAHSTFTTVKYKKKPLLHISIIKKKHPNECTLQCSHFEKQF